MEDELTIDERRKYLSKMKKRYERAGRKEQGRLLDEMEAVTGLHRKSLVRLIKGKSLARQPRQEQRGSKYGVEVSDALRVIAESTDYICAERLTPNLVWLAEHLAAHGELEVSSQLLEQLRQVSVSTVERRLDLIRQDEPRLPRKKPAARRLTQDIPMKRIAWDEAEVGHFETDLVHHCGVSASGEYMYTLQLIDVATGWSERRAVLGRGYQVMQDAFQRILIHLPFPVLEIHPDNGSEFLNYHMVRFWGDIVQGVLLSRSRPYCKNDNRIVEQKNWTLVRAYLGYERLDTVVQTLAVNQLYDKMWLYYNFFQPVLHLKEKLVEREGGQVVKVIRRHDEARTPFDRVCATQAILPEHREQLDRLRDRTNPRQLRQDIYDMIDHIFSLPNAQPGKTEDIHLTLSTHPGAHKKTVTSFPFAFNRTIFLEQVADGARSS